MPDSTYTAARSRATAQAIDQQLFLAWQANDRKACEEVWGLFQARVFTAAVAFCRRFLDELEARQVATSAFSRTWIELEWEDDGPDNGDDTGAEPPGRGKKRRRTKRAGKLEVVWQGAPQLEKYVRNLVIFRCRDLLRVGWNEGLRKADDGREGEPDRLDALVSSQPSPEEELLLDWRERSGWRRIVDGVAALIELCQGDRDFSRHALLEVLCEIRSYLRERFIAAGPLEPAVTADAKNWTTMTVEELVEVVDPHRVKATKEGLYEHLVERLNLPTRNALYLRMGDIREVWRNQRDAEDRVLG